MYKVFRYFFCVASLGVCVFLLNVLQFEWQQAEANSLKILAISVFAITTLSWPFTFLLHQFKTPRWAAAICYLQTILQIIILLGFTIILLHIIYIKFTTINDNATAHVPAAVISIFLYTVGLFFFVPVFYRKKHLPFFNGTKCKAVITEIRDPDSFMSATANLKRCTYSYNVQNRTHIGVSYSQYIPRLDKVKVGDEIEILYDPENPQNSVWPMG